MRAQKGLATVLMGHIEPCNGPQDPSQSQVYGMTKYLQHKVPNHSKRVPRATLAALGASAIEKQIVTPEEAALVDADLPPDGE